MRLLNVRTLEFKEFFDDKIPPYAILSHRWGDDEVSYQVFSKRHKDKHKAFLETSEGYRKILNFCEYAPKLWKDEGLWRDVSRGYDSFQDNDPENTLKYLEWVWIDTCCIDKSSSADLSEAINSMYQWYENAVFCCVYLADVQTLSSFTASEWFTRGWTLQELLAPDNVAFLNRDWETLGTKTSLCKLIVTASGISEDYVAGYDVTDSATIAERFSWASRRRTSRIEDHAYCLFGIFQVSLPLMYGEGNRAFQRLQEELLRVSTDDSIFAWSLSSPPGFLMRTTQKVGWLADSAASFNGCEPLTIATQEIRKERNRRVNCQMTRWGIEMDVTVVAKADLNRSLRGMLVRLKCEDLHLMPFLLGLQSNGEDWHVIERDQQAIHNAMSAKFIRSVRNNTVLVRHVSIIARPYGSLSSPLTSPASWVPIEEGDILESAR